MNKNPSRSRNDASSRGNSRHSSLPLEQPLKLFPFSVVGIGASAGGLDACRKFLTALPANSGMAFILVQHLDPTHESMLPDLLAGYTHLTVYQACDGMPVERNHLYIIPPGYQLWVEGTTLRLSRPPPVTGTRLPIDFLLHSLSRAYRERALAVILSGTGTDGSLGLKSIHEAGGLVIAQDPDEADHNSMPLNAIQSGMVDLVLPVAEIPDALIAFDRRLGEIRAHNARSPTKSETNWLPEIIDLLHSHTRHDFHLYKSGTLQRRIERRMAMAETGPESVANYVNLLRRNPAELTALMKDLLINVTAFFRDSPVFSYLAKTILPDLVKRLAPSKAIRIWVAGCSTGEEAYSLAMLLRESMGPSQKIRFNILASDVDAEAIATARAGTYSRNIEADVSPERLARFFVREGDGYRVTAELREDVVFTVHDLLKDPPFSHIDLISCRNLMIYLQPEAQEKIISLFHFSLRNGGYVLLGSAERIPADDKRFVIQSDTNQLYRHTNFRRPGDFGMLMGLGADFQFTPSGPSAGLATKQGSLAQLCQQLALNAFAPASVLINDRRECLYTLGPTDKYLQVAPGSVTQDLLAMTRPDIRNKLRQAIQQALRDKERALVQCIRADKEGENHSITISAQPVRSEDEDLLFISFSENEKRIARQDAQPNDSETRQNYDLQQELDMTRSELHEVTLALEESKGEQRAIYQEALSFREEFQVTNEELLASKEELQALNEELTALNSQLQETLDHQRTTSNDLQNILFSTNVATLFLDRSLNIRFFTPAIKGLFNVIDSDIGRPLGDMRSLVADDALLTDAQAVLDNSGSADHEIMGRSGTCFARRILPYVTREGNVAGVVITFVDISDRKRDADELQEAKRQADQANIAKSHFLAAASHDLRQPLQTLALMQGILAKNIEGSRAREMVDRMDDTIGSMSGMLNALLDINQIDAGVIRADVIDFPISGMLERLTDEFKYHAESHGLQFRAVSCGLQIQSDPSLLEQMVRNLLANAFKYTRKGRVLLGCRRLGDALSVEIWDTGVGIPEEEFKLIFEEYYQLDNAARERSKGLGLGLSIVKRLGNLLGHPLHVRSWLGKGSVFSIEVPIARPADGSEHSSAPKQRHSSEAVADEGLKGTILIVEDDSDVRELLEDILRAEGHRILSAANGEDAQSLLSRGDARPDLILTDYNLPKTMTGLSLAHELRKKLGRDIPVVVLTGDISTRTLQEIKRLHCVQLNKPVKARALLAIVQDLLGRKDKDTTDVEASSSTTVMAKSEGPTIYIVDDDRQVREALRSVVQDLGHKARTFPSAEEFLSSYKRGENGCLLVDIGLPGMDGFGLLTQLHEMEPRYPAIMITGNGDVAMAVRAMKAGASDFIEKPVSTAELAASLQLILDHAESTELHTAWNTHACQMIEQLTVRQRQVMDMILAGHPNKNIAADLGISQRTVENHRAAIMHKTGSKSLPALARLAVAASNTASDS
ncbi:chemotaxis protein CheB [Pseudokordiimonas caeni]|uniref:chemotaxis protein CheB n=1 Tax=Pseudokordiimonas caeni TaxID=2997908 RepID=UPI002811A413|nr:chemotaxis protein CheB [Pseudokordiimonas caeni]